MGPDRAVSLGLSDSLIKILYGEPLPLADRLEMVLKLADRNVIKAFAEIVKDRSVRKHALHCGVQIAEEWAQKWLSGETRVKASDSLTVWTMEAATAASLATRVVAASDDDVSDEAIWAAWTYGGDPEARKERKQQVRELDMLIREG